MKYLLFLFLVLCLTPPAILGEDSETGNAPEAKGLMRPYLEGAGAMAEGRVEDAVLAYDSGLKLFPDSPHLQLGMARAAAAAGDTASCLLALSRLNALGGIFDLGSIEEFGPCLGDPVFSALAEAIHPDAHPTSPPAAVHVLDDPTLWNEGIACDLATGDLYAGSIKHGKIVRLRDGVQEDFGTTARDGLLEILGLDIDEDRRQLWAVTGRDETVPGGKHDFGEAPRENEIVAYDLETGEQVKNFTMVPDGRVHMWNDITVTPDGTAYFTDMTIGDIYRIPPEGTPELFLTLEERNSPNGIVAGAEGRLLYIACLEEILVADLAEGTVASLIRDPDTYTGLGDGLAIGDGNLFITQNSGLLGLRLLQCRLDPSGRKVVEAHRLRWTQPEGRMPYTCAFGPEVLYVNATASFAQYDDPEPPPPSAIVEIDYER